MADKVNQLASRGKRYIPGPEVDRRYNISAMTRWRWGQNAELDFPQPLRVNGRQFFAEDELEAWERRQAALSGRACVDGPGSSPATEVDTQLDG